MRHDITRLSPSPSTDVVGHYFRRSRLPPGHRLPRPVSCQRTDGRVVSPRSQRPALCQVHTRLRIESQPRRKGARGHLQGVAISATFAPSTASSTWRVTLSVKSESLKARAPSQKKIKPPPRRRAHVRYGAAAEPRRPTHAHPQTLFVFFLPFVYLLPPTGGFDGAPRFPPPYLPTYLPSSATDLLITATEHPESICIHVSRLAGLLAGLIPLRPSQAVPLYSY